MPNMRKQFNIAYAPDSPAVTLIEQAERATGQPASKIVKQVVDAYLSTSLVSAESGGSVKRGRSFWGRAPPPLAPETGG